MKILVNAVSAKSGGAATYLANLMRDLPHQAPHLEVVFYVPPVTSKRSLPGERLDIVETDAGRRPAWQRFLWDQVALRREVRRKKADLLLSSSDFGMLFPPCRQILMIRNPLFFSPVYLREILPKKSVRFRIEFLLRKRLIALSAHFSERVVVASSSMLNDLRHFILLPDSKVSINPFGVPLEKFQGESRAPGKNPLRILFVSEYSDHKNLATVLKAVLRLREQGVDGFHLISTAHPEEFPETEISTRVADKILASDPRIAGFVKYTGPVPYEGIERLYRESDLFVFPSLAESFGHPLVEAMASRLPILASDIPLCREICGEAALYFDPLDPVDLAQKILLLKEDVSLRERLGHTGRQRVHAHFNWTDHVRRFSKILEEVAQQPRHGMKTPKTFSHSAERGYYANNWPKEAQPYRHLEPYLRCWLNPEAVFGGRRVLDLGAGECLYTRLIADRFKPQEIVACDLFCERMLPTAHVNQNPALKFVGGDCFSLPFQNESFDVIFGSLILHQLPNLTDAIAEIKRVLSKGGCYVGIEPNPHHPVHLFRYLKGNHSPNQYLLSPRHLRCFHLTGFRLTIQYFYSKFPKTRSTLLGTCMGITAWKNNQEATHANV